MFAAGSAQRFNLYGLEWGRILHRYIFSNERTIHENGGSCLEHAAYRVETEDGAVWIDCLSAFNRDLEPVKAIYFTHEDFLGASNQYR